MKMLGRHIEINILSLWNKLGFRADKFVLGIRVLIETLAELPHLHIRRKANAA
jgi:hypothetical protein